MEKVSHRFKRAKGDDAIDRIIIGREKEYEITIISSPIKGLDYDFSMDDFLVLTVGVYVHSPTDLFFGNLDILNNILWKTEKEGIIDIWVKLYIYRLEIIKNQVQKMEERSPRNPKRYRLKLLKRMSELANMIRKEDVLRELLSEYISRSHSRRQYYLKDFMKVYDSAIEVLEMDYGTLKDIFGSFIIEASDNLDVRTISKTPQFCDL